MGGKQHGPRNHLHRRISKSWILLLLTCLAALTETLPLPLLILSKFYFPGPGALQVFLSVEEPRHTEAPLQLRVIQAHGHISGEISEPCHLGTIWSILLSTLPWILPQTLSMDKISLCFFSFLMFFYSPSLSLLLTWSSTIPPDFPAYGFGRAIMRWVCPELLFLLQYQSMAWYLNAEMTCPPAILSANTVVLHPWILRGKKDPDILLSQNSWELSENLSWVKDCWECKCWYLRLDRCCACRRCAGNGKEVFLSRSGESATLGDLACVKDQIRLKIYRRSH